MDIRGSDRRPPSHDSHPAHPAHPVPSKLAHPRAEHASEHHGSTGHALDPGALGRSGSGQFPQFAPFGPNQFPQLSPFGPSQFPQFAPFGGPNVTNPADLTALFGYLTE